MIEITRYEPSHQAAWDTLVRQSRNGTFLLRRGYMDYHSDRFDDCSLMAWHEGRLVTVLPANREADTLWSHHGLTYGGWVMPLKHFDVTVMMQVMDAACQWMHGQGLRTLVYKPVPHIYHSYPAEEDLYALFRHGARLTESNVSTTIDLACPLPPDRGNRSGANAARRAGITVVESHDWERYWRLLDDLLRQRYHTRPVHTLQEMLLLQSRFPDNIKLYTATLQGELLAGVVMYLTGTTAHCQYIAASPHGKDSKALALLFSHLITCTGQAGYRYFDFGISNENHGLYLNEGLAQQKARLGGRAIVYNTYQITL